jgi:hypothetical protein
MFLDELFPIAKELLKNPLAFTSGFAAGMLRLDLNGEPVKTWLAKQPGIKINPIDPPKPPQSINID